MLDRYRKKGINMGYLSSLVIEPMTFERLANIKKSETLKFRLKEESRLKQLYCETAKINWKQCYYSEYFLAELPRAKHAQRSTMDNKIW